MESEKVAKLKDVHSRVTNEIVRAIELGASDCVMPWHRRNGAGFPRNPSTGKTYQGVNTLALWSAGRVRGYASPYWGSYRQWKALDAQVKQGEHGAIVVFYKREDDTDSDVNVHEEKKKQGERPRLILRYSSVFNAEQVQGWSPPVADNRTGAWALELMDTFIEGIGADIRYGADSAPYNPHHDRIFMPNRADFIDTPGGGATEAFYAVLLHEHIHWTGHEKRLNRGLLGHYGSDAYAMEELVAELGAAFLCATLGISSHPRSDHAAYIASWLKVLRQLKTAIFVAASSASIASRYLEDLYIANTAEKEVVA